MRFSQQKGYSLLELVATLSVLAILVMGAIPLAQNAARRERETRLRETLRDVRRAIDEFKRDSLGACPQGAVSSGNRTLPGGNIPVDPRSRVVIDDCTIFTTDNIDRFPPSLQVLVDGVKVRPRGADVRGGRGLGDDDEQATDINLNKERKKVYLRELPVDPMTGKTEWKLRSSYQEKDADTWDSINVFDIRSTSDQEALNGDKYSDW